MNRLSKEDEKVVEQKLEQFEFQKEYERGYHFFLAELKSISKQDLAFIIELMRASQHIKDIQKLIIHMDPEGLSEEEEDQYWVENDSLITLILNISAAQLREALKLFWKFSETDYFKCLTKDLSDENRKGIDSLIQLNDEFRKKQGFIWEVLEPMRNSMFHYMPDKVVSWIDKVKEMESERKPPYQSINLEDYDFGPGKEYDKEIYSNYLFLGPEGLKSLMKSQKQVWDTQLVFLNATKQIIKEVLKKDNIPKRKHGWFMEFFHGYKR